MRRPSGRASLPATPSSVSRHESSKADDGSRTRDLRLGKPTLYQLSYVRGGGILRGVGGHTSEAVSLERVRMRHPPGR
jgi:hypothetical protein